MSKPLVTYFSASGQTSQLAKTLATATRGDIFEIKPSQPYTSADLDWNNKHSRSTKEMDDINARPDIAEHLSNMDTYGAIFVGFPIWWYVAPRIIDTFLEAYDFAGKTLIPFATSGGSGMGQTDNLLAKTCPEAHWLPGKRFSASASQSELAAWADSLGIQTTLV